VSGGGGGGGVFDGGGNRAVAEFSGLLGNAARAALAAACRSGAVRVVVCSDGLSRGIDLEGVTAVVHYDIPGQVRPTMAFAPLWGSLFRELPLSTLTFL